MVSVSTAAEHGVRPLSIRDVERVISIDQAHAGQSRRRFFEKRLAAIVAHPDDFIHIGVMRGGSLRGFAIARLLRGEFGRTDTVAALDVIGVEAESQELGVGQALIEALTETMRQRGVVTLQSQAKWTNHDLLRFFDASGFELAPRLALERSVAKLLDEAGEEF